MSYGSSFSLRIGEKEEYIDGDDYQALRSAGVEAGDARLIDAWTGQVLVEIEDGRIVYEFDEDYGS